MKIDASHKLIGNDDVAVPYKASPNHGGVLTPSLLVMHYTAGKSAESSASWLCSPIAKASAHLIIGMDGKIIQLVPFNFTSWHAGQSVWEGREQVNHFSIGIELDNPGRLSRKGDHWWSTSLGQSYPDDAGILLTHKNEKTPCGWHVYPAVQLETAFEVASCIIEHYGIKEVVGHEDVAPGRKSDPGPAFPMDSFRGKLFGRGDVA